LKNVSVVNAGPGPSLIKVRRPRMAMKTKATILIATMITPKFAPIVRDARFRTVTPKIAIMAVIFHQLGQLGSAGIYLECPFWYQSFRVGGDGVVDHPVDVFSGDQL